MSESQTKAGNQKKFEKGLLHLLSRCAENHDNYNSWLEWNKLNTIVKYHEMKLMSTDWSTIDPQKTLEDHSGFLKKLKTLAAQYLLCQLLLVTVFCLHNFCQCLSSSKDKGCLPSHLWMCIILKTCLPTFISCICWILICCRGKL